MPPTTSTIVNPVAWSERVAAELCAELGLSERADAVFDAGRKALAEADVTPGPVELEFAIGPRTVKATVFDVLVEPDEDRERRHQEQHDALVAEQRYQAVIADIKAGVSAIPVPAAPAPDVHSLPREGDQ